MCWCALQTNRLANGAKGKTFLFLPQPVRKTTFQEKRHPLVNYHFHSELIFVLFLTIEVETKAVLFISHRPASPDIPLKSRVAQYSRVLH